MKVWSIIIVMVGSLPTTAQLFDNPNILKANGIKHVESYLVNSESPEDSTLFFRVYFNAYGRREMSEHYDSSVIVNLSTYEYIKDTLESVRILKLKNGQISTKRSTYDQENRPIRIAYFNDKDTEPNWYTIYKYKGGKKVERIYRTGSYKSFEKIKYNRAGKKTYHLHKFISRGKKKKKKLPVDKDKIEDRVQIFENYQNSGLKLVRKTNKNLINDQVFDSSETLKLKNNEILFSNYFYDNQGLLVKIAGYYKNMDSWIMAKYYYFNSDNSDEE